MPSFPVTLAFGLGLFFLTAHPGAQAAPAAKTAGRVDSGPLAVIDPGHGGDETGVKAGDFTEAAFTLDLAKRLSKALAAEGLRSLLTREDGRGLSLTARTIFANHSGADCFVSLHVNSSFTPASKGPRVFVSAAKSGGTVLADPKGKGLALSRWSQSQAAVGAEARQLGLDIAAELGGGTGVQALRLAQFNGLLMPAVVVECGFATQEKELQAMKNPREIDDLAQRLCRGVKKFLENHTSPKP